MGSASKFYLIDDERVMLAADRRQVHHSYSDRPAEGTVVTTYAFEEVLADKAVRSANSPQMAKSFVRASQTQDNCQIASKKFHLPGCQG